MENKTESNFTYDYKTVEVSQKKAVELIDCYEALGWELARKSDGIIGASLTFKRAKRLKNRDKLNRMQDKLDDHFNSISVMEKRKTNTATIVCIIIGIIGALFFGGGLTLFMPNTFSVTPEIWMYIVGSILALIGTVICGLNYFIYKKIRDKYTIEMNAQIDFKREEISLICEDAQRLITLAE